MLPKKLILTGNPQSTNHIYRFACKGLYASIYMTKEGKGIKTRYGWELRSQWHFKPLEGMLEVDVTIHFSTKRKYDIDNYGKLLLDSLTGICYLDDSQIQKMTVEKFYDKKNPRIEITLKNYGEKSN